MRLDNQLFKPIRERLLLRSLFKLCICAFLTVSATGYDANAEEDPFYFCAGAYVEEMKANAVIVLRADMATVDPKAKKYLNCQLPDIDETTLLRLITSGKSDKLESSGLQYFTDLTVAGQVVPVKVMKPFSFAYDIGAIQHDYDLYGRVCGYDGETGANFPVPLQTRSLTELF